MRHRPTAFSCSAVRPSSGERFKLKAANRYWHMTRCSSSAASWSMNASASRCSITIGSSVSKRQVRVAVKCAIEWGRGMLPDGSAVTTTRW